MIDNTISIPPTPKEVYEEMSVVGWKIHVICSLFKVVLSMNQKQIIALNNELIDSGKLDEKTFRRINSNTQISMAKKEHKKGSDKILTCLDKIIRIKGIEIISFPKKGGREVKLKKGLDKHPKLLTIKLDTEKLKSNRLTGIIDQKPLEENHLKKLLENAYELRLLQSSFYHWRDTIEEIQYAIKNRKLRKIKILIGQPYSEVAMLRAHTFGVQREDQFIHISRELENAINGIIGLRNDLGKDPKYNDVEIELRLYYKPSSFPLYQSLDEQGNNILTFMGFFWNHESSYKLPHLVFEGSGGNLLKAIEDNFFQYWQKELSTDKLDIEFKWFSYLGKKKTIDLKKGVNVQVLLKDFKKSFFLRNFSRYSFFKPNWVMFKCFYHNVKNTSRNFILHIAPEEGIARITNTFQENLYYGFITEVHASYSIILHTVNKNSSDRIIHLNIPKGGIKLENSFIKFATYSNNDVELGQPYTQMLLLRRIKKDENPEDIQIDVNEIPHLKNKKITIPNELWNIAEEKEINIQGDYIYEYVSKEKNLFYKRVKAEVEKAESEIYFLGNGPIHFPDAQKGFMKNYLDAQEKLITEKYVTIYRILLNKNVNQAFIDFLVKIKDQEHTERFYKIYISKPYIPVIADLILIDPKDKDTQTAILVFAETSANGGQNHPIKMEVIKDPRMINVFLKTCNEYIYSKDLIEDLKTQEEIESTLDTGFE